MNNQNSIDALSIVELEDRFETTVAAADAERCSNNTVKVELSVI